MSLLTQAIIAEKYGVRLDMDQLADLLRIKKKTIQNEIAAGTFGIKTYVDHGRFADYREVASYLDQCQDFARAVSGYTDLGAATRVLVAHTAASGANRDAH